MHSILRTTAQRIYARRWDPSPEVTSVSVPARNIAFLCVYVRRKARDCARRRGVETLRDWSECHNPFPCLWIRCTSIILLSMDEHERPKIWDSKYCCSKTGVTNFHNYREQWGGKMSLEMVLPGITCKYCNAALTNCQYINIVYLQMKLFEIFIYDTLERFGVRHRGWIKKTSLKNQLLRD